MSCEMHINLGKYRNLASYLRVGAGVHLHHAIYSSTENATDKKLIKIIT